MTIPEERYEALFKARAFLESLLDPKQTPKVPKDIRRKAYWVLRHYPWDMHLEKIAEHVREDFRRWEDHAISKRSCK